MICKFTACPKSNGTMFDAIGKGAPPALLINGVSCHAEYFCKLFCAKGSKIFIWNLHIASIDRLGSRVIPADAQTLLECLENSSCLQPTAISFGLVRSCFGIFAILV